MLKLSGVKGKLNENGVYVAPTEINVDDVIVGTDEENFYIKNLTAGDTIVTGQYFYGLYNDVEKKFVSELKPVQQFNVEGNVNVKDANVTPVDGGVKVSTVQPENGQE